MTEQDETNVALMISSFMNLIAIEMVEHNLSFPKALPNAREKFKEIVRLKQAGLEDKVVGLVSHK